MLWGSAFSKIILEGESNTDITVWFNDRGGYQYEAMV